MCVLRLYARQQGTAANKNPAGVVRRDKECTFLLFGVAR